MIRLRQPTNDGVETKKKNELSKSRQRCFYKIRLYAGNSEYPTVPEKVTICWCGLLRSNGLRKTNGQSAGKTCENKNPQRLYVETCKKLCVLQVRYSPNCMATYRARESCQ